MTKHKPEKRYEAAAMSEARSGWVQGTRAGEWLIQHLGA